MAKQEGGVRVWVEAILIAVVFLRFTNTFVVQTFYIPSSSMEDTLLIGDHLFVNRFIYGPLTGEFEEALMPQRAVRRGDILVFRSLEDANVDVVKRCIAIAGDRVELRAGRLFLNGKRVEDASYAVHKDSAPTGDPKALRHRRRRDNFGPLRIPEGHVFCLGDNRDLSYDSRFWGPLPVSRIKGRAWLIYWSYGGETPDGEWHGAGQRLRLLARTLVDFPFKSRWERSFQLIR